MSLENLSSDAPINERARREADLLQKAAALDAALEEPESQERNDRIIKLNAEINFINSGLLAAEVPPFKLVGVDEMIDELSMKLTITKALDFDDEMKLLTKYIDTSDQFKNVGDSHPVLVEAIGHIKNLAERAHIDLTDMDKIREMVDDYHQGKAMSKYIIKRTPSSGEVGLDGRMQ